MTSHIVLHLTGYNSNLPFLIIQTSYKVYTKLRACSWQFSFQLMNPHAHFILHRFVLACHVCKQKFVVEQYKNKDQSVGYMAFLLVVLLVNWMNTKPPQTIFESNQINLACIIGGDIFVEFRVAKFESWAEHELKLHLLASVGNASARHSRGHPSTIINPLPELKIMTMPLPTSLTQEQHWQIPHCQY